MSQSKRAAITGVGGFVPNYVLTNDQLEKMIDTSSNWIISRTGIHERHILKGKGKGTSVMAIEAVKILLEKTNVLAEEIDLIICATVTPDITFPATANIIAREIGAIHSYSFDMAAACSGFLYALAVGAQFIQSGVHKKIVVVGADKMSSIIDYTDRTTCVIFGDGAGAILLEPSEDENGVINFLFRSDGKGEKYLHMKAGGSRYPPTLETIKNKYHYVYQEGRIVFKYAVEHMTTAVINIMKKNNLTSKAIDYLVPHQANKRIINFLTERIHLPKEKVMMNIEKYGNTTAATIPLCIWDYQKELKKGHKLILTAFGGGFTWGAMYVKWAIDGGSKVN